MVCYNLNEVRIQSISKGAPKLSYRPHLTLDIYNKSKTTILFTKSLADATVKMRVGHYDNQIVLQNMNETHEIKTQIKRMFILRVCMLEKETKLEYIISTSKCTRVFSCSFIRGYPPTCCGHFIAN